MLSAKTRAGEKLIKEGGEAEARKEYDKALEAYEKAYAADPKDPAYQMSVRRMRFQAAAAHVSLGIKVRSAGNLEEALNEFQKAYAIDPALAIADQEIRRTKEMIDREKKKPAGAASATTPEDRGLTPSQRSAKEMEAKSASILAIPELKPITRQISSLKMNNQPIKVLYETVGKLAGINVVLDSEIQPPPGGKSTFTVDLSNTTLEEALDYLAIQTRTYWKPLSPNAIFVTNDNVQKRRDFEDYVVKVFYIKNSTLLQELQEISTTVRSVTEIRRAFTYGAQNAILVRGTADQVALAEKLILDLDKPKAEVVVDILVMQASRTKARDLAATLATGGPLTGGLNTQIVYGKPATTTTNADGTTTTSAAGAVALNRIGKIALGDFSVAVPGAIVQALLSDSTTRVLQQPQVRAVDGQKASLRIGDKVPYATGSFGGGLGASVGVGVSPLVSTQFSFAEVGVNVDMVPKIHGRDEVSLHVELEISNVSSYVKIGDISQPVISQKKIAHDIRIREGEVSLLGGLMQVQDSKLVAGLPWLSSLPVLGPLFGTHHQDNNDSELLIALIPHIVRAPDYTDANLRAVSAGTDQNVKLNYAPRPEEPPKVPEPAAVPAPAPVAPAANPSAAGTVRLFFNPPVLQAPLSGVVTVALQIENAADLFSAPLKLKFDPKILRLTSAKEGNLMGGDGQKINFSENTLNDTGDATVVLTRMPGTGGISGSGALVNLTFQAVGRGTSTVTVNDLALMNSGSKPIAAAAPTLNVMIQ
ncbi:MAG: cohesin domain-containing protein [Bryobacteraceae bacterium]